MTAGIGHNVAREQLRSIVERIEHNQEQKKAIEADTRDIYAEAKANGFDTKVLRHVVKERGKDPSERQEFDAVANLYMSALGMLPDFEPSVQGYQDALAEDENPQKNNTVTESSEKPEAPVDNAEEINDAHAHPRDAREEIPSDNEVPDPRLVGGDGSHPDQESSPSPDDVAIASDGDNASAKSEAPDSVSGDQVSEVDQPQTGISDGHGEQESTGEEQVGNEVESSEPVSTTEIPDTPPSGGMSEMEDIPDFLRRKPADDDFGG